MIYLNLSFLCHSFVGTSRQTALAWSSDTRIDPSI